MTSELPPPDAIPTAAVEDIGQALLDRHVLSRQQLDYLLTFHRALTARGTLVSLPDLAFQFGFASAKVLQSALEDYGVHSAFSGAEADLNRVLAGVRLHGLTVRYVGLKGGVLTVASAEALTQSTQELLLEGVRNAGIEVESIERVPEDASRTLALARDGAAGTGSIEMRVRLMQREGATVEQAAVSALLSDILLDALERRSSDVHFNCTESHLESRIEYRVDRDLVLAYPVAPGFLHRICSIVRERANIDTEDTRSAFDGRFTFTYQGRQIEVRLSAGPQLGGQLIVLRLNDPAAMRTLQDVYGAFPEILVEAEHCCADAGRQGQAVILSGSVNTGKSTALRAKMMMMDRSTRRITAIEDPVEQRIPLVVHKQVDTRPGGMGYVGHLRQTLREDTDVVVVGEARDGESLDYALQVPDKGNTLFFTLHGDDAPSTLRRALMMSNEASRHQTANILGLYTRLIIHHALITKVCEHCGDRIQVRALSGHQQEVLQRFGFSPLDFLAHPRTGGCARCEHRGYRGRALLPDCLIIGQEARADLVKALGDMSLFTELERGMVPAGLTWLRRADFLVQLVREGLVDAATAVPILAKARVGVAMETV